MNRAKMASSILLSGSLAASSALLLAGCSPQVQIGSDIGSGSLGASSNGNGSGAGTGNEVTSKVSCHVGLEDAEGGQVELTISNKGLTATTTGTLDIAKAKVGHLTGKWYFEVHIDALQPNSTTWAENVGAAVEEFVNTVFDTVHMGAVYNTTGSISTTISEMGLPGKDSFGTGDVIGVAMDLDAGRTYFSRNGAWQNGNPATGTGGAEIVNLPGTAAYHAFLTVSANDQMTANFGESKFAYPTPKGFAPYGAGFSADSAGDCQNTGPTHRPVDPAPMTASCDYFTSYDAGPAGGTELHVIGVYEASGGQINVQVDRNAPLVLALSSYEPVQWNVTLAPGAQVERIVLSSYHLSSVVAPAGIPVDSFIYEQSGEYLEVGIAWPASSGGADTQGLIKNLEAKTGLELSSFGGCYAGGSFTLTD